MRLEIQKEGEVEPNHEETPEELPREARRKSGKTTKTLEHRHRRLCGHAKNLRSAKKISEIVEPILYSASVESELNSC